MTNQLDGVVIMLITVYIFYYRLKQFLQIYLNV